MADYPEKPASSDTATESGATDGISARDKVMFGQSLLTAALDEATGLLKLQLGLQTGAVVLFVKVLTDVCAPKLVLAALAVSALLFGASALWCLDQLIGLVELRAKMLTHWVDDKSRPTMFEAEFKTWQAKMGTSGKLMYRSFLLAILFAVIFIVGVLVTR
jgi:hypothetical protein